MIKENLEKIDNTIKDKNILLIAVSKTKPVKMLQEAYNCGIKNFGENKVQEICEKIPQMPNDTVWHFIGHLQTNKVKNLLKYNISLIHSVDSFKLAEEINKQAIKLNKQVNILIEVNIGNEESKFGITKDCAIDLIKQISNFSNIHIKGLMTVLPKANTNEKPEKYCLEMQNLFNKIKNENIDNVNMQILSMGMTNDYKIAINNGSNCIRIGTGIFGERFYKQ